MDISELENHFSLKRSTDVKALNAEEKLEELMDCGKAKRCKLYKEYEAEQRKIAVEKNMKMELNKPERSLSPSSLSDYVAVGNIEGLNPEDQRLLATIRSENKNAIKHEMGENQPRIVKKTIRQVNGRSLTLYMNIESNTNSGLFLPKLTAVIKCLDCDTWFADTLELDQHNRNHLLLEEEQLSRIQNEKWKPNPPEELFKQEQQVQLLNFNRFNIKSKLNVEKVSTATASQPKTFGNVPFRCHVCTSGMDNEKTLQTHLAKFHPCKKEKKNERSVCEFCERSYKGIQTLRAHIKKIHPEHYIPQRKGGFKKR